MRRLVIRKEQAEVFRQLQIQEFEDQLCARLQLLHPQKCSTLGESGVRASIQTGITKALGYGLEKAVDIRKYIDLMYALGHTFDEDPRYPWARSVATNSQLNAQAKIDRLSQLAAMELAASSSESPSPDE